MRTALSTLQFCTHIAFNRTVLYNRLLGKTDYFLKDLCEQSANLKCECINAIYQVL